MVNRLLITFLLVCLGFCHNTLRAQTPIIIYYGVANTNTKTFSEWYYVYENDTVYYAYSFESNSEYCQNTHNQDICIEKDSKFLQKLKKRLRKRKKRYILNDNSNGNVYIYKFIQIDATLQKINCVAYNPNFPFYETVGHSYVYKLCELNSLKIKYINMSPPPILIYKPK